MDPNDIARLFHSDTILLKVDSNSLYGHTLLIISIVEKNNNECITLGFGVFLSFYQIHIKGFFRQLETNIERINKVWNVKTIYVDENPILFQATKELYKLKVKLFEC